MLNSENRQSPIFIWIFAFIIMHLSSEYSIFFLYTPGTADVYLTFSIGVVLIYWLGPRVLILAYINALINCYFWGHELLYSWPIFALPETTFFFLSWLLFIHLGKGKFWLPNLNSVVKFLLLGISIPLTVYMIFLKYLLVIFSELDQSELWGSILASWMGDFMPTIMVSLPILFYASKPFYSLMNWRNDFMPQNSKVKRKHFFIDLIVLAVLVVLLNLGLDFKKYWYLFGLISLIVSVRYGFGITTIVNLFILIIIYFLPASIHKQTTNMYFSEAELLDIYLGTNLLALFSIISGRVISDYRQAQASIRIQMEKVERINSELDRFVYSVSHDLIAPLKSIKGLINLIHQDSDKSNTSEYVSKIEKSADKLGDFIGEILDYSRNTRQEVIKVNVDLEQMIQENLANHRFIDGFDHIKFDLTGLKVKQLNVDELRVKIILNNLISNAIKFSRDNSEAFIRFYSGRKNQHIYLEVEDNGEGIPEEYVDRIFEMFYRASVKNPGSGLGLFIAQEAAKNMKGSLSVESKEGVGSRFILTIPE